MIIVLTLPPDVTGLPSPLGVTHGDVPTLSFGRDVRTGAVETRRVSELGGVLYRSDPAGGDPATGDAALYAIYRDVRPDGLSDAIEQRGLCYTLLVVKSGTIPGSPEWARTRGHTNPAAPGTPVGYPEIHEVLQGEARLYLQEGVTDHPNAIAVMPLYAGDKAVVAPGWASLLANVGTEPLVVGTWRMADCLTAHQEIERHGGMAYFVLEGQGGEPVYAPNPRYRSVPEPRPLVPKELPAFGLTRAEPLLAAFHQNPEYLRCLLRPQDFADVWKTLYD